MDSQKCFFCDSPATKLCDFLIGTRIYGFERVGRIEENRFRPCTRPDAEALYTCDMPLCEKHAHWRGNMFVCGKGGFMDTIDRCPVHMDDKRDADPITDQEAEMLRRAAWAQARRMQIKVSGEKVANDVPQSRMATGSQD